MNHMTRKSNFAITVYYDGLCRLCSREISHYRKQAGAEKIRFLDITAPDFDAIKEGVDPHEVHQIMHVRRADGSLAKKVDAFIEIWSVLPRYQWAVRVARLSGVRKGLDFGYALFALVRPYLPRKSRDCATSPYCEVNDV
jgi:predicted DCC family thiol-disulfide oxidoreductase YuxK